MPTWSTRLRPEAGEPGDIVDEHGRVLGRHRGIAHFTVGQRKGLGIAVPPSRSSCCASNPRPAASSSARANASAETRVPLGRDELARAAAGRRRRTPCRRETALGAAAGAGDSCWPATGDGDAELVLDAPAGAVAPGQAAVLYDGDRVLGGGWIRRPASEQAAALDRARAISYMRSLAAPARRSRYAEPLRRGSSAG